MIDNKLFRFSCDKFGKYTTYHAYNKIDNVHLGFVTVILNSDEYPRYKNFCNGDYFAKIVRIQTEEKYCGNGIASALIRKILKDYHQYNFCLLCSPSPRGDNDTLKTVRDLKNFYSKFGFKKTGELIPTMIRTATLPTLGV